MHIDAFGATHNGNIRSHNEDNIYVEGSFRNDLKADNVAITGGKDGRPRTYAVLDGLGGEESGEKASFIGALGLKRYDDDGRISDVEGYVDLINRSVIKEAAKNDIGAMGTTFVMVHIDEYRATIANVGDSRAYLLQNGEVAYQTEDHIEHSVWGDFINRSFFSYQPSKAEVEIQHFELKQGDRIFLCTDGVSSYCDPSILTDRLVDDKSPDDIADVIMFLCEKFSKDNYTGIIVYYDQL